MLKTKALIVGSDPAAGHNYLHELEEMIAAGMFADLPKGQVSHLSIYHGDDCGIFAGGRCDCTPEFELTAEVK